MHQNFDPGFVWPVELLQAFSEPNGILELEYILQYFFKKTSKDLFMQNTSTGRNTSGRPWPNFLLKKKLEPSYYRKYTSSLSRQFPIRKPSYEPL